MVPMHIKKPKKKMATECGGLLFFFIDCPFANDIDSLLQIWNYGFLILHISDDRFSA